MEDIQSYAIELGVIRDPSFPCGCPQVTAIRNDAWEGRGYGRGPYDVIYRCITCGAGWSLSDWLGDYV